MRRAEAVSYAEVDHGTKQLLTLHLVIHRNLEHVATYSTVLSYLGYDGNNIGFLEMIDRSLVQLYFRSAKHPEIVIVIAFRTYTVAIGIECKVP